MDVRMTRRRALEAAAATLAAGGGLAAGASALAAGSDWAPLAATVPFHGRHQAGIATPQQAHLHLASFGFDGRRAAELRDLLKAWSQAAATLTAGRPVTERWADLGPGPTDTGEAAGLGAASLTVTIGLGRTLFELDGRDRLGLRDRLPAELAPLPRFRGEQLDPSRSGGDLCVQACADDPLVAFHAVRTLARIASGRGTRVRWNQLGFLRAAGETAHGTPRNLLGFKDGTDNLRADEPAAADRFLWVQPGDGPDWLVGGTYLVARRIRVWFDTWDATSLVEQERTIGRHKASGAPLGGRGEFDPVRLDALPADAHVRLAAPAANGGVRILRRGYSFADAVDPADGQLDGGLFFVGFQRSVQRQFVPLQSRLAAADALNPHTQHTGSAVFACPPGAEPGGYVGQTLFE